MTSLMERTDTSSRVEELRSRSTNPSKTLPTYKTLEPLLRAGPISGEFYRADELLDTFLHWTPSIHTIDPSQVEFTGARDIIGPWRRYFKAYVASWLAGYVVERLAEADTPEEIIDALRLQGLNAAADRVSYLRRVVAEDPDEPPIQIESLRRLAQFLVGERSLGTPRIGVSPDGLMQIEWLPENGGIIAMWFLANGNIQFSAIAGKASRLRKNSEVCSASKTARR